MCIVCEISRYVAVTKIAEILKNRYLPPPQETIDEMYTFFTDNEQLRTMVESVQSTDELISKIATKFSLAPRV